MRLTNMIIEEVSLVDKAANKKKFLLYKRDNGGGEPVKLKVEDVAKMTEVDLRKHLTEFVTLQDSLEKSVADFEAKVKKAAEAHEADLKELEAKDKALKEKEASLKKQNEPMKCADCDWTGPASDLKEGGKCPKCGSANVSLVDETAKKTEKAVTEAVAKTKAELEKAHAAAIKERDEVIDELVGAVDSLKKSVVTKSEVEGMLKEAIATFKKNIR